MVVQRATERSEALSELKSAMRGEMTVLISWESMKTKYSPIAQSVERVTVNHDVVGSSPTWGARKRTDTKWCPFSVCF